MKTTDKGSVEIMTIGDKNLYFASRNLDRKNSNFKYLT